MFTGKAAFNCEATGVLRIVTLNKDVENVFIKYSKEKVVYVTN
jgi:hypothetical protein